MPLPQTVLGALLEHRERQQRERESQPGWQDTGYVFVSRVGTAVDPGNFSRLFVSLCERAGGPPCPAARLEAHVCVDAARAGGHPRVVMEIAGHSAMEMTMNVYGHVNLDSQRAVLSKLDDLIGRASDASGRAGDPE